MVEVSASTKMVTFIKVIGLKAIVMEEDYFKLMIIHTVGLGSMTKPQDMEYSKMIHIIMKVKLRICGCMVMEY